MGYVKDNAIIKRSSSLSPPSYFKTCASIDKVSLLPGEEDDFIGEVSSTSTGLLRISRKDLFFFGVVNVEVEAVEVEATSDDEEDAGARVEAVEKAEATVATVATEAVKADAGKADPDLSDAGMGGRSTKSFLDAAAEVFAFTIIEK